MFHVLYYNHFHLKGIFLLFFPFKSIINYIQFPLIHPLQVSAFDSHTNGFLSLPISYNVGVNGKGKSIPGKDFTDG